MKKSASTKKSIGKVESADKKSNLDKNLGKGVKGQITNPTEEEEEQQPPPEKEGKLLFNK